MNLNKCTGLVKKFMDTFDQKCYTINTVPPAVAFLRGTLIEEEINEYEEAKKNSVEELDAICDLLYVVLGTNLTLDIPVTNVSKYIITDNHKYPIRIFAQSCIQDLKCRFPCTKIQSQHLHSIATTACMTASSIGYDLENAFEEVHRSNMTKLWTTAVGAPSDAIIVSKKNGFLVKRSDGKILKPPTFELPNLTPFMP